MSPISENRNNPRIEYYECLRYVRESAKRNLQTNFCPLLEAFEAKILEERGYRVYIIPANAAASLGYGHEAISLVVHPILQKTQ